MRYCILIIYTFIACSFVYPSVSLASTSGTIDVLSRYAWGENVGWIDFGSSGGAVTVTDSGLSGYAYGENIGWIVLSGVTNIAGDLSGYAWGENVGWIDFDYVTIGSDGVFSGSAYGENIGHIIFDSDMAKVMTDWRPASSHTPDPTPTPPSSSSGGHVSVRRLSALLTPSPATTAYLNLLRNTTPDCPTGVVCTPAPTALNSTPTQFSRSLTIKSTGPDVRSLQLYLNAKGFTVALSGPGSPGNETSTFGNLTRDALARYQKANGISPPAGYFGPITRSFMSKNP